jgi:hypothetical protein
MTPIEEAMKFLNSICFTVKYFSFSIEKKYIFLGSRYRLKNDVKNIYRYLVEIKILCTITTNSPKATMNYPIYQ